MFQKINQFLLFFGLCLFFSSCSIFNRRASSDALETGHSSRLAGHIDGWEQMVDEIERKKSQIESLKGNNFNLKIYLEGDWDLIISPEDAFETKKVSPGNFKVIIRRPELLFEKISGLLKRTYIAAKLQKVQGDMGKIDLTGAIRCQYLVSFIRPDGKEVNFDEVAQGYDYSYDISEPELIKLTAQGKYMTSFERGPGSGEDVFISLKLSKKKGEEVYKTNPLRIPACTQNFIVQENKLFSRHPDQCFKHIKGGPKLVKDHNSYLSANEIIGNNCPASIECDVLAQYGLIRNGKAISVDKKHYRIVIPAQDYKLLDTSYTYPSKQLDTSEGKLYSFSIDSRSSYPISWKGSKEDSTDDFVQCKWTNQAPLR